MRPSRIAALCVGCLISLAAGGLSATLPHLLGGEGNAAAYFKLNDTVGSWRLRQRLEVPEEEREMLGATRCWRSHYQCQRTQHHVVATLAAGPAGRIAAHSPEVCYAASDYHSTSAARTLQVEGVEGRFWIRTFRPRIAGQPTLTVVYAWHDGGCWRAPQSPRWELVGSGQVCRLQVSCQHPEWAAGEATAALVEFVHRALVDAGQDPPGVRGSDP